MSPSRPGPATGPAYVEQLTVPLRWWAVGTMFWASVLLAFLVAMPAVVALLVVGSLAAMTVLFFLSYGGAEVSVVDGVFRAGRAEIPTRLLAEPRALDAEEAVRRAGVDADARAFLLLRPYARAAVMVRVTDPADPAPYWLVATRHPVPLAQALEEAIALTRG